MCTQNLFKITSFLHVGKDGRPETWFAHTKNYSEVEAYANSPHYRLQKIPCGQCQECRMEYAKQWAFRCWQEAKKYENNIMLTLTYSDENIPKGHKINAETGEVSESLTLRKQDQQKFIKRLRKHYGDIKIKIHGCGEYGSHTMRPHYHITVFNLKVDDMEPYKKKTTEYGTHMLYKSKTMDKIWGLGFVDLNEVTYETCAYISRYVTKKQLGHKSKEWYELQGKIPEYTFMSKGIGRDYYGKYKEAMYEKKTIWQKTQKGLVKITPGRYYEAMLKEEDKELLEQIKSERAKRSQEILQQVLSNTSLNIDEYNQAKHEHSEKRLKQLKRA